MDFHGHWIWTDQQTPNRNAFVRFRRTFDYSGGPATMRITADSRYILYVNGSYIGQGPVRAWPAHWRYDTYDIAPYLRRGSNTVAVLVNHFGEGNFQYIAAPPGFLAEVYLNTETILTNNRWRALPDRTFVSAVPRISVQEQFEEQFDARLDDGWTSCDYDDSSWPPAVELRGADDGIHRDMAPRGIPYLTLEPVLPQRVVSAETVRSIQHVFTINYKPYLAPDDKTENLIIVHAYLVTQIWASDDTTVSAPWRHNIGGKGISGVTADQRAKPRVKINGDLIDWDEMPLKKGWNSLVAEVPCSHVPDGVLCLDGPPDLRFCCTADKPGAAWAIVGPFSFAPDLVRFAEDWMDEARIALNPAEPTAEAGLAFWESCDISSVIDKPWFRQIEPEHLPEVNVFARAYTDKVAGGGVKIDSVDDLLSGSQWTTIYPDPNGDDIRILLDFGRELLGYHSFEVDAPAGTILDFHDFEFIQPDGRYNFAEGMNNSFRYTCREGSQSYQTYLHRGFQYSYVIIRNATAPVKLRRVQVLFNTYPQSRRGSFSCSDWQLNRIWEVGAHSLRCCAEDTYTDCPTYEQTHWVGDARNEALIDWAVNGDPRLWYRCLEQTGDSLDRSPITESHVPSSWQNVIPSFSCLWMRSCREYLLFTGDTERSRKLLAYIEKDVEGLKSHLDDRGLFSIRAWNMFDWADMDTPTRGVVTHQNCFIVLALEDAALMADELGRSDLAQRWRAMAGGLALAINAHLWNDEKQAYTDCIRDGAHSKVFSQQTQTIAYIGGVARDERATRCREILFNPPEGFVRAGSPFFQFFVLEALQDENRAEEFIDMIRRNWGFMVDTGASTFWEMWSGAEKWTGQPGRLTRSHCHGWSGAPTFFLSTYVLGVRPASPGFAAAAIEPHPGDITWCRGIMPTPHGDIEVQWENESGKPFALRYKAPEGVDVRVQLPRTGIVGTI